MNIGYNFDKIISRRDSDATKYRELDEKFGRTDLLPLWIADMDFATPTEITDAVTAVAECPVMGYSTPPPEFKQSIAGWLTQRHSWNVTEDEIDYIPGVKKGLGLCVNYFTRPDDAIVIQPPVYHSFRSVVEGNGRKVLTNPLVFSNGEYRMDIPGLENIFRHNSPAMLLVCNPHNPIGVQWDADTLAQVAALCRKHNVTLLSDEIYADLVLPGKRHIPTASVSADAEAVTVTLGAPSKTFNMPGMASAWTAVKSSEIRERFFAWLNASEFDTPPVCAIYSTIAAYTRCKPWLDSLLQYLDANRQYAQKYIRKNIPGVDSITPDAGFGLWIDFRAKGLAQERLNSLLIDDARLALSDGASFGDEGTGFARFNFGVPRKVLDIGLERLTGAITKI